ncbi:MFS transporter [Xylocopilactobacillus apis]|uniref:Macrolide transporter n=1 Tax=Xylocopilactobacillus apis TaxID=2932183 RepID=A0AAU9CPT2_9LACO|nr:MFS transporter [Xylocopilactobacillus apis]BDR55957.1 macrolide transporter [Xylocopilactobacillus apis]
MNSNIIRLLTGRVLTNISDSLVYVAVLWYFNETFKSPVLATLVFVVTTSIDLMSFIIGPLLDRTSSKFLLELSTFIQVIATLLLAIFFVSGSNFGLKIIVPLFLLMIVTIASTIIYPLESKMLPQLTSKNELIKVNSVFQITYKTLDIFLDAIATIIITYLNLSFTFVLSGLVFAAAFFCYRLIKIKKVSRNASENVDNTSYLAELKIGWDELKSHPDLLELLLPLVVINFFYGMSSATLPRFASHYLSNSALSYGLLLTFDSVGAVVGAFGMQFFKKDNVSQYNFIFITLIGAGIGQLIFAGAISVVPLISMIGLFLNSAFTSMLNISFMSLVQIIIPNKTLGRVTTINESLLSLMIPIGSFVGGLLITCLPVVVPQYLHAIAFIVISFVYLFLKK